MDTRDINSLGGGSDGRRGTVVHSHDIEEHALMANRSPSASAQALVLMIGVGLSGWLVWGGSSYTEVVFVLLLTLLALVWVRRRARNAGVDEAAAVLKAEYGVPHTSFQKKADGFIDTYKKLPAGLQAMLAGGGKDTGALAALFILAFGGIGAILYMIFGGTRIEVTNTEVVINGKRLSRKDFGGFCVHHTVRAGNQTFEVLGCRFGLRSFSFGGAFAEGQGSETASALNMHLRNVWQASDGARVSAAELREARTDF